MNLAQLTQHDGKRLGIPAGTAVMIVGFRTPPEDMPKAKSMLRWVSGQGAVHSFLREELKQLRNLMPVAHQGLGWQELEDEEGNVVLIPQGSATGGYIEKEDGVFHITLDIVTGPVTLPIRIEFNELAKLAGFAPEAEEPSGPRRPRRSKSQLPRGL